MLPHAANDCVTLKSLLPVPRANFQLLESTLIFDNAGSGRLPRKAGICTKCGHVKAIFRDMHFGRGGAICNVDSACRCLQLENCGKLDRHFHFCLCERCRTSAE